MPTPSNSNAQPIIGIIGGMGPEATSYFFDQIVRHTPADSDQEHLPIIVMNIPQIPDRTNAVYGEGENPTKALQQYVNRIYECGVDILTIPCVSIHYFINGIKFPPDLHFINILSSTVHYTRRHFPNIKKVGILGTDLTVRQNLFQKPFAKYAIEVIKPNKKDQEELVMKAIYLIKAGVYDKPLELLSSVIESLQAQGAQAIVSGCTEVPIVLNSKNAPIPFVDCLHSLAVSTIDIAKQK